MESQNDINKVSLSMESSQDAPRDLTEHKIKMLESEIESLKRLVHGLNENISADAKRYISLHVDGLVLRSCVSDLAEKACVEPSDLQLLFAKKREFFENLYFASFQGTEQEESAARLDDRTLEQVENAPEEYPSLFDGEI